MYSDQKTLNSRICKNPIRESLWKGLVFHDRSTKEARSLVSSCNLTSRISLELREDRTVHNEHPTVWQKDNRRRCYHRLIAVAEPGIRLGILEPAATVSSAKGSAERRAPATIGEDEAKHGKHHQQGGHPLALLSGREGWTTGDAYTDADAKS